MPAYLYIHDFSKSCTIWGDKRSAEYSTPVDLEAIVYPQPWRNGCCQQMPPIRRPVTGHPIISPACTGTPRSACLLLSVMCSGPCCTC